jgi:hypothetical protein
MVEDMPSRSRRPLTGMTIDPADNPEQSAAASPSSGCPDLAFGLSCNKVIRRTKKQR